jgi:flagellar biosynthetic protein FlhB
MAEGGAGDSQEKTEEPTPKKKADARKEGKVVTSKEMFVFASMLSAIVILMAGSFAGPIMARDFASFFRFGTAENFDTLILVRLKDALKHVLIIGMVLGVPMLIATVAMQAAMGGGLLFATANLKPKFSKINLFKGLKRMVSAKAIVELLKAVMKVTMLSAAAGLVLWQWLPQLSTTAFMEAGAQFSMLSSVSYQVLIALVLALAIIGAVDLIWQIHTMSKQLKMSLQEIKDESKQTEGSPEVKGAIRRKQMEAAQSGASRRAALDDVKDATAIITNPKHFSVALRYVPGEDDAPTVLALGEGAMAFQIRELGKEHDVTILPVPPLARALYFTSNIGGELHPALYAAVATILAHVYHLDQEPDAEMPPVDLPKDFRFDEFGKKAA